MYLSLDNALRVTGWSIFNDQGKLIKTSTWETNGVAPIEQRLGQIWQELNNLHNEYNFNYLFFEDCYKQPNLETYKKLAFVQATILLWCYFNDVKYAAMLPSHWRKVISDKYGVKFGKTRVEQKQGCVQWIKTVFNKDVTEDEADSIAIGIAGLIEKKVIKG